MIEGKRVAVVMPAYNAEKTLEKTAREIPDSVDIKILVDDHSWTIQFASPPSPAGRALNSPAIELVESKLAVDPAVEQVR